MIIEQTATEIYQKTKKAKTRIVINEGSSRSSKTYSICQMLFHLMFEENNKVITIVRKTGPSLKATVYKDFMEIIKKAGIYNPKMHNKSELTYKIRTNEIEFISVDDYNKIKGRKRHILFCNEANELNHDEFTQLALRTTERIYMDYNPSHDEFHWIEDKIKTRDDVIIIKSTYKDNPFNSKETIREIERLKEADPNLWRIYGLGLFGISSVRIYSHIQLCDMLPKNYDEEIFGLDFGFNHPTVLTRVRVVDDIYYVKQELYESGLTNSDLGNKMINIITNKNKVVYYDTAEPQRAEELRRLGFNMKPANKDVKKGIDSIKSKKVFITKDSVETIKESRGYSWKTTKDGQILDEPVKINDDGMDSMRYGIHSYLESINNQPRIRQL